MTHAWAKLARQTGRASGCTMNSATPAAMKGTTWAIVMSVHVRPVRSSRRASTRGRQWTAASSGSGSATWASGSAATGSGLPAGDRQAHDHELGVDRQLAHLLGVTLTRRDHPEVAVVELFAEGLNGGLDCLRVVGCPLGQGRVT